MAGELRLPNVNSVNLAGRVTRDLELRYTPKGTPVLTVPLAFDRNYKDANGEWQRQSNFIDVVTLGQLSERLVSQLHKGSAVLVEGNLQTRTYVNRENQNVKITEIVASRVHVLEKDETQAKAPQTAAESVYDNFSEMPDATYDDVPF